MDEEVHVKKLRYSTTKKTVDAETGEEEIEVDEDDDNWAARSSAGGKGAAAGALALPASMKVRSKSCKRQCSG